MEFIGIGEGKSMDLHYDMGKAPNGGAQFDFMTKSTFGFGVLAITYISTTCGRLREPGETFAVLVFV